VGVGLRDKVTAVKTLAFQTEQFAVLQGFPEENENALDINQKPEEELYNEMR